MADPAAGKFEFAGGHMAEGEPPRAAAIREWQEETGLPFPDGEWTGTWTSANGIYQGFVLTIPREADLDIFARRIGSDPDGDVDGTETIAWWDPADLGGDLGDRWWSNPALRDELRADLPLVMAALAPDPCCGASCCQDGGCCGGTGGCSCGPSGSDGEMVAKCAFCPDCGGDLDDSGGCMDWQERGENARQRMGVDGTAGDAQDIPHPFAAERRHQACAACGLSRSADIHEEAVAKAGESPKGDAGGAPAWPGWDHDLRAAGYWAPLLAAALAGVIGKGRAQEMARAWLAGHPGGPDPDQGRREAVEAASAWVTGWLASQQIDLAGTCQEVVPGIVTDGWLIGGASAASLADGTPPDWGGWQPGDGSAADRRLETLGIGSASIGAAYEATAGAAAEEIASGFIARMARALIDGLAEGSGAVALGGAVFAALSDEGYAHGSVLAQLVVAVGAAAMAVYLARKVAQVCWVTEDANACPLCAANEAGSPYPIASAPGFPGHPRCRCALLPA